MTSEEEANRILVEAEAEILAILSKYEIEIAGDPGFECCICKRHEDDSIYGWNTACRYIGDSGRLMEK